PGGFERWMGARADRPVHPARLPSCRGAAPPLPQPVGRLEPAGRPPPPYLRGFAHRGEPVLVTEFGGISVAGESGGYSEARDAPELVRRFRDNVDALMTEGPVEGFCYTQLADVEHERNGLLTFDRQLKVDPAILRPITKIPKRR